MQVVNTSSSSRFWSARSPWSLEQRRSVTRIRKGSKFRWSSGTFRTRGHIHQDGDRSSSEVCQTHSAGVPTDPDTRTGAPRQRAQAILAQAILVQANTLLLYFFCISVRRSISMVRRGWSTVEVPSGWLQVIRGPKPPAVRWPPANKVSVGRSSPANVQRPESRPPAADRRRKPKEVRAMASSRVCRQQSPVWGPTISRRRRCWTQHC